MLSGAPTLEVFSTLPAVFVENQGQWADDSVRYAFNGSGASVAMTDHGPVFQLYQEDPGARASRAPEDFGAFEPLAIQATQFSASFAGANTVVPTGEDQTETVFNYFVGDQADWRSNVPGYATVAYENLYEGIDLKTWGKRDGLKYEFHVAPGADYRQIRVSYAGIEGLTLAEDGSLRVHLGAGWDDLVDDAPYVYQMADGQQVAVDGQFELVDFRTVTFAVAGDYDPNAELVIDPELAWSTYLGGAVDDTGYGVAVDGAGNTLVIGDTLSSGWVSGGLDSSYHDGPSDAYVAKLSPDGMHLWSTYLGGSGPDIGYGIVVDDVGDALVTGRTASFGWVSGGFDTSLGQYANGFVAKLSPMGEHIWSTYLCESGAAYSIALDNSQNALVTGITYSAGWTSGGFDTSYNGGNGDGFVAKLSPSGVHLWSTYLGGSGPDVARSIVVDHVGNALVTGTTDSSSWISGGFDTTLGSFRDAFVAKLDPTGGHIWSTYLGGSGLGVAPDYGYGIAVDLIGNAFVTGYTQCDRWVSGGFDTSFNGSRDGFVAKLSPTGAHLWSTYLGGSGSESGYGVAVDSAGNALVTGWTDSTLWAEGGFTTTYGGGLSDAFVAKLSPTGAHVWSAYLGGGNYDGGNAIATNGTGDAVVTGYTNSTGWISRGFDTSYAGGNDAFVAKIRGAADMFGDLDHDGAVDIFDVAVLQTKYGMTSGATWADGDFDGNGTVDIFDVALMQVNYGKGVASIPAAAPSADVLDLAQPEPLLAAMPSTTNDLAEAVALARASNSGAFTPIAARRGIDAPQPPSARLGHRHARPNGAHASVKPAEPLAIHHAIEGASWESAVDEVLEGGVLS
ncbi:MAG: DUF7948 domain-containing protein [Pirellulales bacterium]